MKETKKMMWVLGIALLLVIILILVVTKKGGSDKEIMDDFYELFNSRKYELLYIGKTDCGYCQMFDNNLKEIKEVQEFDYLKINVDKILATSANEIIERLEISELSTPYIAVIKEGEVVENFGYIEPKELLEKLKAYDFVDMDLKLGLNYLELGDYYQMYDLGQKSVIAFSSTDNNASQTKIFKNVLKEISTEKNIEINYLELLFTTEDEYNAFASTFEIVNTESIPIIAIIEKGKIVDYLSASTSKEEILALLQKNNIIK